MACRNTNDWFLTEPLGEGAFRISEPLHPEETNCWLLVGRDRALLFDSGLGVADIGAVVKGLTDKPVRVLASHVHWDHIGGHGCFGEFYVHEAELGWIEKSFPLSRNAVLTELYKGKLPEGFDAERYELFRGEAAAVLRGGDIIYLGGRRLEVIHTPGHSPGHVCLWEAEQGWLFTGDTVYKGCIYADFPSTDPEALLDSLERLARLPVKRIFPGHHDCTIEVDIILRMRNALRKLKAEGKLHHGGGCFNFGDWGIRL